MLFKLGCLRVKEGHLFIITQDTVLKEPILGKSHVWSFSVESSYQNHDVLELRVWVGGTVKNSGCWVLPSRAEEEGGI